MDVTSVNFLLRALYLFAYAFEMYLYCLYSNNITATVKIAFISKYFRPLPGYFGSQNLCGQPKSHLSKSRLVLLQYDTISTSIYCSSFMEFDTKSKRAMLLLMQIADARPMTIKTVTFVTFELGLDMFLKVVCMLKFSISIESAHLPAISWIMRIEALMESHSFCSSADYQNHLFLINADQFNVGHWGARHTYYCVGTM